MTDVSSLDSATDPLSVRASDAKPVDFTFEIGVGKHDRELVKSTLRPGLMEFLYALSEEFEPILFTSALQIYAEPLLDKIEASGPTPNELRPLWRHRIYRPGTVHYEGGFSFVKDISRFGRPMERIVLIDNSWAACIANLDNSIVVPDYLNQRDDNVLPLILTMLRRMKNDADVRPYLIQTVKLREAVLKAGVQLPN